MRFEEAIANASSALNEVKASLKELGSAPLMGDLFIFIEGETYNVSEFYRRAGFSALPPTPTLSGAQIMDLAKRDSGYSLFCEDALNEMPKSISMSDAVPLISGMRFFAIPPCYGAGVDSGQPRDEFSWSEMHSRYRRRDWRADLPSANRPQIHP